MKKAAPCEAAFRNMDADEGVHTPHHTFHSPR
jgi:hypothetical protein